MNGRGRRGRLRGIPGPLRAAIKEQSSLRQLVKAGVAALAKPHRGLMDDAVKVDVADSLDLDAALEAMHPQEHRWDYLVGLETTGKVVAIESHTATDKQVSVVIKKRAAAKRQLRAHLRDGVEPQAWIWVTEGQVGFAQTERAVLQLAQAGITFANRKILAKHLPES